MNDPSPSSDPLAGLYCPACDYELTGLTVHRCPECGCAFDPAVLRVQLSIEPRPIQPWQEVAARSNWFHAYLATALAALRSPSQFGRSFPRVCEMAVAVGFGLTTRVLTGLLVLILVMASGGMSELGSAAFTAVYLGVSSLTCNLLLASGCQLVCQTRRAAPIDGIGTWFGLFEFGTVFTPIAVTVVALTAIGTDALPNSAYWELVEVVIVGACAVAVVLWWWVWVIRALMSRAIGAGGYWIALLGVPVIALASTIGVGAFLATALSGL